MPDKATQLTIFPLPEVRFPEPIGANSKVLFGNLKGYTLKEAVQKNVIWVEWYLSRMQKPISEELEDLIQKYHLLLR